MKINRKALIEALKAVQPGLASKEVIEQSTCFVFTEDGNVVTYNDEIAVSFPIAVNFTGAVPAKEFFGMLNKVSSEEIEIIVTDNELLLKGSKAKTGLRLQPEVTLPIIDLAQPEEDSWKKLPKEFCNAVAFCLFTVSKDQTKQILTCLHINGQFMESTDNHRITQFDMGESAKKSFKEELLIPSHAAKTIIGYKPISFARTEGWLHFRNTDGLQFSCRVFDEVFPDIASLLDNEGDQIIFPDSIPDIMDRAAVINNGERVSISIDGVKLTVRSEGDAGWFEEAARVVYDKDPIEFDIAPEFMKSIMKITNAAEICNGKLLKFSGENFTHIVGLVKPTAKKGK